MNKSLLLSILAAAAATSASLASQSRTSLLPPGQEAQQLVTKPADSRPVIPMPVQPDSPLPEMKEDPFVEETAPIVPTEQEKATGMVVFTRPLTEPIWSNTNPQPFERLDSLSDFGAPGQYVTLNLAVYPLAELKNLRILVDGAEPEVRLVRYWNIVYPNYNSHRSANPKRYRRMPEFLVPVTACDAPAREPQRFYLTFKLPEQQKTVSGSIQVFHDACDKAVKIPYNISVLPYKLLQDPNKNYSSYYYQVRSRSNAFFSRNKDNKELVHKVQLAEFRRMLEYGFTRPPTFQMSLGDLPDGTKDAYQIPYLDEFMAELKEAGFKQGDAIPVTGCSAQYLYQIHTGLKLKSFHMENIECDKIPQKLYDHMESALVKFLAFAKAHNYPDIIYNPIDEPSLIAYPYVSETYKIFKKHGLTTFLTSPPKDYITKADNLFDIYNYGAFHVSYEEATNGHKKEYWCYPNDNAYQIKDPYVMCHGGRHTYGLGYWRSGFHNIIPWIWRSMTEKRICNSGGNIMMPEDGTLYMTTYWENFRQGVDDLKYIYTLETAVVQRENATDPKTRELVDEAKALLQKTWNTICPQAAYLRDNLLPHAQLDAIRASLADMTVRLMATPATNDKQSPSVIIDTKGKYVAQPALPESPNIINVPLRKWKPIAKELTLVENGDVLDTKVAVDHLTEGEGYGGGTHYPLGWPRIRHEFMPDSRDFTKFTSLDFELTVSSDRDVQNDYNWPLSISFRARNGESSEFRFTSTLEPNVKHKISIPISRMQPISREGLKNMEFVQLVASESGYPHGCNLHLVTENVRLVGFTVPTIVRLDSPAQVALFANAFSCPVRIEGLEDSVHCKVACDLLDSSKNALATSEAMAMAGKAACGFSCKGIKKGDYVIRARLYAEDGTLQSEFTKPVRIDDYEL